MDCELTWLDGQTFRACVIERECSRIERDGDVPGLTRCEFDALELFELTRRAGTLVWL